MTPQDLIRKLPSYVNFGLGPFHRRQGLSYVFGLLLFVTALEIRWLLDEALPLGFPYLTFFPAVVIAAFVAGVWPGILVAVLCGIASWYYFIPPLGTWALTGGSVLALGFYVFIVSVDILLINMALGAFVRTDRLKRKNEELATFQKLLIQELDHRIKNLFTVVASVVKLSSRYAETPQQLAEEVSERILALGRSHGALWRVGNENEATVESVARLVLQPYLSEHGNRISIGGHSKVLDIRVVQILSLIFHELATNAAKYGALSQPGGVVEIASTARGDDENDLTIEWRERGILVPDGAAPAGFGTELIERLVGSIGGKVEKVFDKTSMTASVRFPST